MVNHHHRYGFNHALRMVLPCLLLLNGCLDGSMRMNEPIPSIDPSVTPITTSSSNGHFNRDTLISEVINDPVFDGYGHLLFPIDHRYMDGDTLASLQLTWYSHIDPSTTVDIVNTLYDHVNNGKTIFYDIYTDQEKKEDPTKNDTGLFFFQGDSEKPVAICNAGGGFAYVGAMQDSFPHALELSKHGYNAFALIYRPGAQTACEDLAKAIAFLFDHQDELDIDMGGYSLWGGSAGARMVAWLGSYGTQAFGQATYPKPSAIIMQYTGHSDYTSTDPATFAVVGDEDGIANWHVMQRRIQRLSDYGIPTEFHHYPGLGHGFGLGIGTVAQGWIDLAIDFWMDQL